MGLEDPRGFSMGGAAYVSATINLEHRNTKGTGYLQQKMVVARLDASLRHLEQVTVLQQPYLPQVKG